MANVGIPEAPATGRNYARRGSDQSWVAVPNIGVVDGSNAQPGEVGEYISTPGTITNNFPAIVLPTSINADFRQLTTFTVPAGDWTVGAEVDGWSNDATTSVGLDFYLGRTVTSGNIVDAPVGQEGAWYITTFTPNAGASGWWLASSMGPIRINTASPVQLSCYLMAGISALPVINITSDCFIWARRTR